MKKIAAILIFSVIANLFSGYAQVTNDTSSIPIMKYDFITMEDGLSIDAVSEIIEDARGFIWVATADGLNRYDGYGCKIYRHEKGDSLSLVNNFISALFQDKENVIWVGTHGGLSRFNPNTETFTNYLHAESDPSTISDNHITDIAEDQEGNLWVGTTDKGVNLLGADRESFQRFPINLTNDNSLPSFRIHLVEVDTKNRIWIGTHGGGLFLFDETKQAFDRVENCPSDWIGYFDEFFDGTYAVNGQTMLVKNGGIDFLPFDRYNQKLPPFYTFEGPNQSRYNLYHDSIVIETASEKTIYQHRLPPLLKKILPTSYPKIDNRGNLWFGHNGRGIIKLSPYGQKFTPYLPEKYLLEIAPGSVTTVLESRNGDIWIGTSTQNLYRYHPEKEEFEKYELEISVEVEGKTFLFPEEIILRIRELENGEIWVSGAYSFYQFDAENNQMLSKYNPLGNSQYVAFADFIQEGDALWLATRNAGIVKYHLKNQTFENYTIKQGYDKQNDYNQVFQFIQTKSGQIWLGTAGGLTYFNPQKESVYDVFQTNGGDQIGGKEAANVLLQDSKGKIWVSVLGEGLYRIDPQTKNYDFFDEQDGISANLAVSIREDEKGFFWIWAGKNLIKLNADSREVRKYGISDGLLISNGCEISYKNPRTGRLFFGLNSFFPEEIIDNPIPPKVVISKLEIYNEKNQGRPKNMEGISYQDELNLKYDDNLINIELSSLNFSNPASSEYAYQLKGFSDNWINLGNQRTLSLTNLDPGTYELHLKAANEDDLWSSPKNILTIHVSPPWWQTGWAYLGYTLLLIALGWRLHLYQRERTRRLEREKTRERELAQAREIEKAYTELEKTHENLKATQAQLVQSEKMASLGELTAGIAHEIQNPLNFVNNFSEVSKELVEEMKEELDSGDPEEAKAIADDLIQNLDKIYHHGKRADGIIKSMLEHSRSSGGEKTPTDLNRLADEYLRLAYHGLRAKDKTFNAAYEAQLAPDLPQVKVVTQDIARVLLNLINNAFYAAAAKAKVSADPDFNPTVTVTTKKLGDQVEITVTDNGNGIPAEIQGKIFQPFFTTKPTGEGTGLGLSLSYDIVQAHGGELRVESVEGESTTFSMRLPVK